MALVNSKDVNTQYLDGKKVYTFVDSHVETAENSDAEEPIKCKQYKLKNMKLYDIPVELYALCNIQCKNDCIILSCNIKGFEDSVREIIKKQLKDFVV